MRYQHYSLFKAIQHSEPNPSLQHGGEKSWSADKPGNTQYQEKDPVSNSMLTHMIKIVKCQEKIWSSHSLENGLNKSSCVDK